MKKFEEIYCENYKKVNNHIKLFLQNTNQSISLSDDITHDTFIKFNEKYINNGYFDDSIAKPITVIITIGRNMVLDNYRKKRNRNDFDYVSNINSDDENQNNNHDSAIDSATIHVSNQIDICDIIDMREKIKYVCEKMTKQSDLAQKILYLFFFESYKINEIAEELNQNPSTVKVTIHRFRAIL